MSVKPISAFLVTEKQSSFLKASSNNLVQINKKQNTKKKNRKKKKQKLNKNLIYSTHSKIGVKKEGSKNVTMDFYGFHKTHRSNLLSTLYSKM